MEFLEVDFFFPKNVGRTHTVGGASSLLTYFGEVGVVDHLKKLNGPSLSYSSVGSEFQMVTGEKSCAILAYY